MPTLQSGSRIGSYEIISAVGAGGMGEVYRARDTKLKRDVAIKVLPTEFSRDPDRMARFRREAELLASLNHSNIAQIYGLEDAASVQCLVLEFVDGETLQEQSRRLQHARVSPNGQYVAYEVVEGVDSKIEVYDVTRGATATRLTQEGADSVLAWHPNGKELTIFSRRQSQGMYLKNLNGSERLLLAAEPGTSLRYGSWDRNGKLFAYGIQRGTSIDIWVLPEDGKARPFRNNPAATEYGPMFSPDGKYIAFTSNRSGREEVYISAFPDGEDIPISSGGGKGPVWGPGGNEIFYEARGGNIVSVSIAPQGQGVQVGKPVKAIEMRAVGANAAVEQYAPANLVGNGYDIFKNGEFLMARGPEAPRLEIVVVQNWFQELLK